MSKFNLCSVSLPLPLLSLVTGVFLNAAPHRPIIPFLNFAFNFRNRPAFSTWNRNSSTLDSFPSSGAQTDEFPSVQKSFKYRPLAFVRAIVRYKRSSCHCHVKRRRSGNNGAIGNQSVCCHGRRVALVRLDMCDASVKR